MREIFRVIPRFKDYQISDLGNVRSLKFGRELMLKPQIRNGYRNIVLSMNGFMYRKKVAYFVLISFVSSRPENREISHLNGNHLDDRLRNLKWETYLENIFRRNAKGEKNGNSKLKEIKIMQIRKLIEKGYDQENIAFNFNISQTTVSKIKNGYSWSHIE